uniref:Uncharacterized protein n=1 Tax=Anguilla anguilla TaxID=7936 RepID=A0A0E9US96_ANGAN
MQHRVILNAKITDMMTALSCNRVCFLLSTFSLLYWPLRMVASCKSVLMSDI